MAIRAIGLSAPLLAALLASCAPATTPPEEIARLGTFATLAAAPAMKGVVIGVPHGERAPLAEAAARSLHADHGAGVVVARGFQAQDISVTAPIEGRAPTYAQLAHTPRAAGVYLDYVRALRQASGGAFGLYVELRESEGGTVQVASVGLSHNEAVRIKALRLGTTHARVEPADALTFDPWGTRHDGVLLIPPKGLAIMLPRGVAPADEVARWLRSVIAIAMPVTLEAAGRAPALDRGRFSWQKRASRVVVAAPHGSGDSFTDEIAVRIAERLGANVVIAHGFMGTRERKQADRIAVNRPLEGAGIHTTDSYSSDAATVYAAYLDQVKALTAWPPAVYIEIHCNAFEQSRDAIEIATVGVSRAAARGIKETYRKAAERAGRKGVAIRVEPDDTVYLNAFGAKQVGILAQVPAALHIELPYAAVLHDRDVRAAYIGLLAEVLATSLPSLTGN